MPRSFQESREAYVYLASKAGVPRKFHFDKKWKQIAPETIRSSKPVYGDQYARVSEKQQIKWLGTLIAKPKLLKSSACLVILGDYLAESAERVAYGLLCMAIRHGVTGKVFHPADTEKGPPKDVVGATIPYKMVVINRIHTDDDDVRRKSIRDFVTLHYSTSFNILVVYGDSPLDFFYKKIGLKPQGILYFPYQGKTFKNNLEDALKEH